MYQKDGLTGGHVIILGRDNASVATAREALAAWPQGLQLGGGVNAANAMEWLDAGADKLIVTSFVFSDGKLQEARLADLVKLVGKEQLVLDLSCRKRDGRYYVVTDRWQKFSDLEVCCSNRVTKCMGHIDEAIRSDAHGPRQLPTRSDLHWPFFLCSCPLLQCGYQSAEDCR